MRYGLGLIGGLVLAVSGSVHAEVLEVTGQASGGTSISTLIGFEIHSPTWMTMTITHDAADAGDASRMTAFGLQLPNQGVTMAVDEEETDGRWAVETNYKVVSNGAERFNWGLEATGKGATGLRFGDQLILQVHSEQPLFAPLDITQWQPTAKKGYLLGARFQSVGLRGQESGLAYTTSYTNQNFQITPTPVPEPSAMALMSLGVVFIGQRRGWFRRAA